MKNFEIIWELPGCNFGEKIDILKDFTTAVLGEGILERSKP